jgi:hypothetical protein
MLAVDELIGWADAKLILGERDPEATPFLPDGYWL